MDLFNNPMIEAAKKAMTPEQLEEYKAIGEYMYNNIDYARVESTVINNKPTVSDLARFAEMALKSGGSPQDLSEPELQALEQVYGREWYERFDLKADDVPKSFYELIGTEEAIKSAQEQSKKYNLTRNQRRHLQRKLEKAKSKVAQKRI